MDRLDMVDRPLSPITERSSFSSRRSMPSSPTVPLRSQPIREISYESEREQDNDEGSLYSQVSSGETITARTTIGDGRHGEDGSQPAGLLAARPSSEAFSTSPSPSRTPRGSLPSTPTSQSRMEVALPGGLLPPPRGKRDSAQSYTNRVPIPTLSQPIGAPPPSRRRQSHVDSYPGGREPVNLDETDDEADFDARSVATATTAGLAGLGAGERGVSDDFGREGVEKVQVALKGIMEEQDMQMKRFRENAPTPPRSRPNSFFHDPAHPTLHNIPTFADSYPTEKSPIPPPLKSRPSSKLFKSPPASRPVSRPGSIRGDKSGKGADKAGRAVTSAAVSDVDHGWGEGRPVTEGAVPVPRRGISMQDALELSPPSTTASLQSHSPTKPSSPAPPVSTSPTRSLTRNKTAPSTKKRTSRIIPNVIFSLFSDAPSERKRESIALGDEHTHSKLRGEAAARQRSTLAKSKPKSVRAESKGRVNFSQRSRKSIPAPVSDGLHVADGEGGGGLSLLEATVRKSGTFGVRDDDSGVFHRQEEGEEALESPRMLGLGLRRWSSGGPVMEAERVVPLGQPLGTTRDDANRQRSGSLRTDITTGTARTFSPDRQRDLYSPNALDSAEDLIFDAALRRSDGLPPISERSHTGHSNTDHHYPAAISERLDRLHPLSLTPGHDASTLLRGQPDISPTESTEGQSSPLAASPGSAHSPDPDIRTPGLVHSTDPDVSAVTPPHPHPKRLRAAQMSSEAVHEAHTRIQRQQETSGEALGGRTADVARSSYLGAREVCGEGDKHDLAGGARVKVQVSEAGQEEQDRTAVKLEQARRDPPATITRRKLPTAPLSLGPHQPIAPLPRIARSPSPRPDQPNARPPQVPEWTRARPVSFYGPPQASPAGLPPLPPSLSPPLSSSGHGHGHGHGHSTADLPLLIASHLFSSHATSLMRHSAQANGMGEEFHRLAQESLDWGRLLMSMAGKHNGAGPEDPDMGRRMRVPSMSGRYDGMPGLDAEGLQDAFTRLPPRRDAYDAHLHPHASIPIPSHPLPTSPPTQLRNPATSRSLPFPSSAPIPIGPTLPVPLEQQVLDEDLSRSKQEERRRKSESLPPQWFQRVEHLGERGWDSIHEAEAVWRDSMEREEAGLLLRSASTQGQRTSAIRYGYENEVDGSRVAGREYLVLTPLSQRDGEGEMKDIVELEPTVGREENGGRGGTSERNKLTKRSSRMTGSRMTGTTDGGGTVRGGSTIRANATVRRGLPVESINGEAGVMEGSVKEGKKSRWWRRG
ncbi:uncharacterized protein MKK02DRAFT_44640 [Dioszegia hungarica]|uniref:Uncharacterized protein n=1 Tax=Dioszegia hungarica TaxID=4972 RepID=A0AA38LUM2_9TREE|nr:uncharacterized protein MKK02DRAFT_44640 [Dioszegia hungarica]KAI9635940.1 hypothetical protein MKK02DRAFT_44640 [Dioszegia hungarica]